MTIETTTVSTRLDINELERLDDECKVSKRKRADVIRKALEFYLLTPAVRIPRQAWGAGATSTTNTAGNVRVEWDES